MLLRAMAGLMLMVVLAACSPQDQADASGCRHIGRTGILECK